MEIAVTGGAGFIGSNLVKKLCDNGKNIKVIDNLSTGKIENLLNISKPSTNIELFTFSITDLNKLIKEFRFIRQVYHLAAIPRIPRSVENPVETAEVNIMGTLNVLEAARKTKVKRVIFASSSSVKGMKSPYALQKNTGEQLCKLYSDLYGLETVVLRYHNVYGPNMDSESDYGTVVPRFINEDPITIYGSGEQTRCLTFVDDVIDATIKAMGIQEAAGKVIDIGAKSITINKLADMIGKKRIYAPSRPGEQMHSEADSELSREILGWRPKISIKEGLELTRKYLENVPKEMNFVLKGSLKKL